MKLFNKPVDVHKTAVHKTNNSTRSMVTVSKHLVSCLRLLQVYTDWLEVLYGRSLGKRCHCPFVWIQCSDHTFGPFLPFAIFCSMRVCSKARNRLPREKRSWWIQAWAITAVSVFNGKTQNWVERVIVIGQDSKSSPRGRHAMPLFTCACESRGTLLGWTKWFSPVVLTLAPAHILCCDKNCFLLEPYLSAEAIFLSF